MSLVLANSYNENDATDVRDYSESLNDGTGTNLFPISDTFGYYLDLAPTSFYNITASDYGDVFTYYIEFLAVSLIGTQYLFKKAGHSEAYLSGSTFNFVVDGVTVSITGINLGEWNKIALVYDGANVIAYKDTNTAIDTQAQTTTGYTNPATLSVGYDGSANGINCRLREFRVYDTGLDSNSIGFLMASQQGVKATLPTHNFNVGDLIIQTDKEKIEHRSVVFATDSDELRLLPMNGNTLKKGFSVIRCGHRWDTDRQDYFLINGSTTPPEIAIFDGVNLHSDLDSDTKKTITVNKNGIVKNSVTKTANYTATNSDQVIYIDSSGGNFTITLPATPTNNKEIDIIDYLGELNANNVIIDGNGKNINGKTTATMTSDWEGWQLRYNGASWNIK